MAQWSEADPKKCFGEPGDNRDRGRIVNCFPKK
jgi:hypothetical protein